MYLSTASWSLETLVCVCVWREQHPSVCVLSRLITHLHLAPVLWALYFASVSTFLHYLLQLLRTSSWIWGWSAQTVSLMLYKTASFTSFTMNHNEIAKNPLRPTLSSGWSSVCVKQWPEKPQSCSCWPTLKTTSQPTLQQQVKLRVQP